MKKKRKCYTKDRPRQIYSFFIGYNESSGAPSFLKFARSIGVTLSDIEAWREKEEFNRAYIECSEIRRDYLIDSALAKRFDASVTKFLLSSEFGMGEKKVDESDTGLELTLEVLYSGKKE